MKKGEFTNNDDDNSKRASEITRRDFLKAPTTIAASLVLPPVLGNTLIADAAKADTGDAILDPRYYPLEDFTPEFDLHGKLAVITGASRGIGRATAEALIAKGAEVIGTSRDVAHVPDPPVYSLLDLDITKPNSVDRFVTALTHKLKGRKVDILINNAGRYMLGNIIPPATKPAKFYFDQLQLGMDTLYHGHVRVTNALLPFLPTQGYARLLFTVSSAAYLVGGNHPVTYFFQPYTSAKRALLAYANSLRGAFGDAHSNILISTVNPYTIRTALAEHPNPIYTEPVNDTGFTDDPPTAPSIRSQGLLRQAQANALPSSFVGDTYVQLLTVSTPPANVVVASTEEPFATQAGTAVLESMLLAEHAEAALRFRCG